ncbi:cytidylyltransferase domain-containing protein [Epilithonimonas pallida]|uniref:Spore coat polysaccharide biosynthesis protein SpsF n=1 Tax=Epilithonimonas pallida TaxID=373671 RepID=A0ABY1R586_9FLAO|nr:hypothetical protein [Epilithonimonas pallida]SMP96113.1 spore coat polysaccharide biosynthesis protein SpsF [Epilithonimonas pallida]
MLGIIIQARLGSTRLPAKILKPFQSKTILSFLVDKLLPLNIPVIIATTTSPSDDELVDYLEKNNYKYYRGSESNVLERYIESAEFFGIDKIIRITSDNPFLDTDILQKLIANFEQNPDHDYWSFVLNNKPTVLSHIGIFAELVSLDALRFLRDNFSDPSYSEHVTFGIYNNPESFKIHFVDITNEFSKYNNIRLTIDTPEDYENTQLIEKEFKNISKTNFFEIGNYILSNQKLKESMEQIIINNTK